MTSLSTPVFLPSKGVFSIGVVDFMELGDFHGLTDVHIVVPVEVEQADDEGEDDDDVDHEEAHDVLECVKQA